MIVEGLIPDKGVLLTLGAPGAGKTWFALECALALALERKAFGKFQAQKRRTLFIGEDSPDWDLGCMMRALERGYGLKEERLELHENVFFSVHKGAQFSTPEGMLEIIDTVEKLFIDWEHEEPELDSGLIVLDSLRRLHRNNENSSDEMAVVMRRIGELAKYGCVMPLHHIGKSGQNEVEAWERVRGSGEIMAGCDAAISIKALGYGRRSVRMIRSRAVKPVDFDFLMDDTNEGMQLLAVEEKDQIQELVKAMESETFSRAELQMVIAAHWPKLSREGVISKTTRWLDRAIPTKMVWKEKHGVYRRT